MPPSPFISILMAPKWLSQWRRKNISHDVQFREAGSLSDGRLCSAPRKQFADCTSDVLCSVLIAPFLLLCPLQGLWLLFRSDSLQASPQIHPHGILLFSPAYWRYQYAVYQYRHSELNWYMHIMYIYISDLQEGWAQHWWSTDGTFGVIYLWS